MILFDTLCVHTCSHVGMCVCMCAQISGQGQNLAGKQVALEATVETLCFKGRDPPQQFKCTVHEVVEASFWLEEGSGPTLGRVDSLSLKEEGLVGLGESRHLSPTRV